MRQLRIPLRVVLYKEDHGWIAHCLELDLVGDGDDQEAAIRMLVDAIDTQLDSCLQHKSPHALFSPAEARFFEMFAAGKNVAVGEIMLSLTKRPLDHLTIENLEAREYRDAVDSEQELVLA